MCSQEKRYKQYKLGMAGFVAEGVHGYPCSQSSTHKGDAEQGCFGYAT